MSSKRLEMKNKILNFLSLRKSIDKKTNAPTEATIINKCLLFAIKNEFNFKEFSTILGEILEFESANTVPDAEIRLVQKVISFYQKAKVQKTRNLKILEIFEKAIYGEIPCSLDESLKNYLTELEFPDNPCGSELYGKAVELRVEILQAGAQ